MTAETTRTSATAAARRRDEAVHTVTDVRCAPGELKLDVDVAGIAQEVWFRTDAPVTPNADAALAACLLPAQLWGGTLAIDAPISPRLLRNQRELQAIQRALSREWDYGLQPLRDVEVRASARERFRPAADRGVATFFSGGVDSWAVVRDNPDVTHLVFVRGFDLGPDAAELADEVERRLRAAAADLGRTLYVVETNVRQLSERLMPWETYFGCPLAAVALLLAPLFERVLIAGDADYGASARRGPDGLVDHLWSTEELEIAHGCGHLTRIERTRLIVDDPVAQRTLRVCWRNPDGAYNCGRCRKCLSTLIALEALDAREAFTSFPPELDLTLLDGAVEIPDLLVLTIWQDVLDLVRERRRDDLEPAVAEVVARGKRRLGLPSWYRQRDSPTGRLALAELNGRLETVTGSRSWRLTAPLRHAAAAARARRRPAADRSAAAP